MELHSHTNDALADQPGCSIPKPNFFAKLYEAVIPDEPLIELLTGQTIAALFKRVVDKDLCMSICDRYKTSQHKVERLDDVPASYIGTFHYQKPPETYIHECRRTRPQINRLTEGIKCPVAMLHDRLRQASSRMSLVFRPANYNGEPALPYVARAWSGGGQYLLLPHEDIAQLRSAIQSDFEIRLARTYVPVAFNVYLQNTLGEGTVRIWNIIPALTYLKRLGLEDTGYPIPQSDIESIMSLQLQVETGDVLAINGSFVHAVSRISAHRERVALSFFCSQISDQEIVYWT